MATGALPELNVVEWWTLDGFVERWVLTKNEVVVVDGPTTPTEAHRRCPGQMG